ncbi:LuxR family transcriptional regulator [Kribbella soli]|uniref:LuxR family transcriptional regulator n=1 Tax=Kribbella soli TaxID=1124743 RepID=A0A4R0HND7_9ACTN|nr:LuxR family transcriptional regulator [Kribbella soli]
MRERALTELRRAVPFDAHVWTLTDPVTRIGTSPLADIPGLSWPDLPALIQARYLNRGTRWTDLVVGDGPVVWRRPDDVDVLTAVFADRFGCWAWLDLWRTSSSPFTSNERDLIASVAPFLTTALRSAQARTFTTPIPPPAGGPAVLVLGADLQVQVGTPAAREALHRLNPPDDPAVVEQAIPAAAYNLAAALVAAENGVPVGPPWSRVHLGAGRWITLRAARTAPDSDIAVTIEESTPAERLEVFALAHALTPREREILAELTTGADSRHIAQRLVLSEHTVNDHVKAVLAKTGASTRPTLLARVAGTG